MANPRLAYTRPSSDEKWEAELMAIHGDQQVIVPLDLKDIMRLAADFGVLADAAVRRLLEERDGRG